jgi:hypothetical protein
LDSSARKILSSHVEELLNRGVLRQLGDVRRDPPRLIAVSTISKYLVVVGRPNHTNN